MRENVKTFFENKICTKIKFGRKIYLEIRTEYGSVIYLRKIY
jgi:hypothetical protein